MFMHTGISGHSHPTRHAIAAFAARSASEAPGEVRPHPNFFIFLLLLVAWCLGEPIPVDDDRS